MSDCERHLMRFPLLACVILSLVVPESRACFCFSTPLCNQLPSPDGRRMIFVGTVTSMYPHSLGIYGSIEAALRKRDRTALARTKALILRVWGPVLSPDEARSIRLARSRNELDSAGIMGAFAPRARFRVKEWIEGNSGEEIELFTDPGSCGYRFQPGKEYLVVSYQNTKTDKWWTGACSRTAPVDSENARQDLKALRAWREGQPLAPRIYGQVFHWRQPGDPLSSASPDALIRLTSASSEREVRSDAEGRFSFENLEPTKQRIELVVPEVLGSPQNIDLSRGRCFEAQVVVDKDAKGVRYGVLGGGAPRRDWASDVFSTPPPNLSFPTIAPLIFSPIQPPRTLPMPAR